MTFCILIISGDQEEMINQKEPHPKTRNTTDFDDIFEQLPPLVSHEYIRLLESPEGEKIPPEVLVRAYRQLCNDSHRDGMKATFRALTKSGNLRKIRGFIKEIVPPEQHKLDSDDLEQMTWSRIFKTLPTERGAFAEIEWFAFAKQRAIEAWRDEFGRDGGRLKTKSGKETVTIRIADAASAVKDTFAEKSLENLTPFDTMSVDEAAEAAPWHAGLRNNQLPLIEKIISETIAKIEEPFLKWLAEDQFGGDPSPISGDRSKTGKVPLTDQTGFNRDQISKGIRIIKGRLAGALLANKDLNCDVKWLKKFTKNTNKSTKKQTKS